MGNVAGEGGAVVGRAFEIVCFCFCFFRLWVAVWLAYVNVRKRKVT